MIFAADSAVLLSKTYHELLILCQIFPYLSSLHVTVFSLLHKRRQIIFNHNILIKIMLRPDPTSRFLAFAQLLFTLDYETELDCQLAAWQLIWWQMNDISLI